MTLVPFEQPASLRQNSTVFLRNACTVSAERGQQRTGENLHHVHVGRVGRERRVLFGLLLTRR